MLVPVQNCVNELDKFTVDLQNGLHKLGGHLWTQGQGSDSGDGTQTSLVIRHIDFASKEQISHSNGQQG